MKSVILILFLSFIVHPMMGETFISRKVIIQQSNYYYVSVDEETQIHYLNFGSIDQPFAQRTTIELPWGAHFDWPTNAFMWDIFEDTFYCVNTIQHSLNDRHQNIKKVSINDVMNLKSQSLERHDYVYKGIDQFAFLSNLPHAHVSQKYVYMDTYFSDMMVDPQGNLHYLTHVDNDISYFIHNEKKNLVFNDIGILKAQPLLFTIKNERFLIAEMSLYKIVSKENQEILTKLKSVSDTSNIVIIDKDKNEIRFSTQNDIENSLSMSELLKLNSITPL